MGYSERRNNVTASASTGDENTQFLQVNAFQRKMRREPKNDGNGRYGAEIPACIYFSKAGFRNRVETAQSPALQSTFLVMLSRMPMLARVQASEVPPEEMSGRGMPLVGSRESTTLMLKKA